MWTSFVPETDKVPKDQWSNVQRTQEKNYKYQDLVNVILDEAFKGICTDICVLEIHQKISKDEGII